MFIVLFLLVFICILLLVIHDRIKYRRIYKLLEKFPGPKPFPLIGSAHEIRSFDVVIDIAFEHFRLYGATIALWIFRVPIVSISDPKQLKIVLNSENCLDKEKRYKFSGDAFGNGLLLAPGKLWKKNRKLINPTFNKKIVDSFVEIFVKHGQLIVEQMEKDISENTLFDVDQFLLKYTMNILTETAMGLDDQEIPRPPSFVHDMNRMSQIILERTLKIWLHPDFIFRQSSLGREFSKLLTEMKRFLKKLFEKKYDDFYSQHEDELLFDDNKRKPFFEHLLSVGKHFTIDDLIHEVSVFLTAGSDTTAATVGYVLVCLGALTDIQENVVKELNEVFGDTDRPICLDDIPKLQYLERVIKETMRIYPTAPFIARSVTDDIDIGDYIIPKDTSLVVPIIVLHRNEKFWPNPLKFDPDRFLPSKRAERHPYSYLPFSGGPRNCIGKHYAMVNMKVILTSILRKYKIATNIKLESMRCNVQVVARIIGGANITIAKREP